MAIVGFGSTLAEAIASLPIVGLPGNKDADLSPAMAVSQSFGAVTLRSPSRGRENLSPLLASRPQVLQFVGGEMLNTDEEILGGTGPDEFVQLHLYGCAVPVLRVLDQEHHQNVTIVVPVLMTSCQVSENRKRGPVTAQMTMAAQATTNVDARPAACEAVLAMEAKNRGSRSGPCWLCRMLYPFCFPRRPLIGQAYR